MSSIIKSSYTRVISPNKPVVNHENEDIEKQEDKQEIKPCEKEEVILPDEPETEPENTEDEQDLKDAYNELVLAAQEEVALIFEDARKQVENMKNAARDEMESEKTKVFEDTYAEAYEKGYAEGIQASEKQASETIGHAEEEAETLLSKAYAQRDKLVDGAETQILELALKVARKIVKTELENNEDAYLSMVKNAIAGIKVEKHITLRVNPGDYVRHFKSRETTLETPAGSVECDIINDASIPYGGCLIETEGGTVDAGADAQIFQTAAALGIDEFDPIS